MSQVKKLTIQEKYHAICAQHVREMEKHEKLLELIRDDLKMRADDNGAINISDFIWRQLNEAIEG